MEYEMKAIIVAIALYVKKMDMDDAPKRKLLAYFQQLLNADTVVLELPKDETGS